MKSVGVLVIRTFVAHMLKVIYYIIFISSKKILDPSTGYNFFAFKHKCIVYSFFSKLVLPVDTRC